MSQIQSKFLASGIPATKLADGSVSDAALQFINSLSSNAQTQISAKVPNSEKGAAGGVATLDGGGKVPVAQLPNSIMEYQGTWAASTNTPTLADGVGNAGDVYIASDAGTVDFGSGNITFAAGDWVIYDGAIWQKSVNSNAVASVNGDTGAVVVNAINELTGEVVASAAAGSQSKSTVVSNAAVIAKVLTGYVSGAGVVAATDSILQAIQKLNGNIAALPGAMTPAKEDFTGVATPGTLTLANAPIAGTVTLLVQGAGALLEGAALDYTVATNIVTLSAALDALIGAADNIQVQYFY